jgi:DNA-binding transcriptional MocR family regulator
LKLLPQIQHGGKVPLPEQIATHFERAIEARLLRSGDRLPTIRAVASRCRVTRSAVQKAYQRLAARGLVESTVGRGTTVKGQAAATSGVTLHRGVFAGRAEATFHHAQSMAQIAQLPPGTRLVVSFARLAPGEDLFPVRAFSASLERVLREHGGQLLDYGESGGQPRLRALLAQRNAQARETDGEILVTNGAQQGLDLVLRAFTEPGDSVAVAVPTYHHLFGLLKLHGLQPVVVAHGAGSPRAGFDAGEWERALALPGVRLLYVMPTFHNPTGNTLSAAERAQLMEIVQRTEVPVLEDEFERELRFAGEPLPSLRSLDRRGLTVTVASFSKGLFPGVRIGWLQGASDVIQRIAAMKRFCDLESSPLLQVALADFIEGGQLDRHLEAVRAELKARHEAARAALRRAMPEGTTWTEPDGGYVFWVELPAPLEADVVAAAAARAGVLVTPGRLFDPLPKSQRGLRLSLSSSSVAQIGAGIDVLGACARELLRSGRSTTQPLFL